MFYSNCHLMYQMAICKSTNFMFKYVDHYYYTVDDVSATNCIISPTNINTLTINTGSKLIEFNCQCMDGDDIITGTSWFHGNTLVTTQGNTNYHNDDHYYNNITVGRLLIDTFNSGNSGTYTCSPNSTFPTIPPGVTITLNAAGE